MRFQRKRNVNAWRVGFKVIATLIGLWASGYALNIVYILMNGTYSPFYQGLALIGLTVQTATNSSTTKCAINSCSTASCDSVYNCITGTSSTSLLAIVGIIAIIWVIFEFVDVKM